MARARRNNTANSNRTTSNANTNNRGTSRSSKSLRSSKKNDNITRQKTSIELAREIINATRAVNSKPQTITVTDDGALIIQTKKSLKAKNNNNNNPSKNQKKKSNRNSPVANGIRSIDGRLFPSDDIGVLLRDASQANLNNNKNNTQQNSKRNNSNNNNNNNNRNTNNRNQNGQNNNKANIKQAAKQANRLISQRAINKMVKKRKTVAMADNLAVSPYSLPSGDSMLKNRLVINTNSKVNDQILVIYNLTIGTNGNNLKKIIQNLSRTKVADLIVKDLPTGSAVAYITINNQTVDALQKLKDFFNGALIDGRTVKVEIISKAIAGLTY